VAGQPATFSATVTARPDAAVASYAWDFTEDGVTDDTSATPTHTFHHRGTQGRQPHRHARRRAHRQ
jgi:PKD repeat protein